MRAVEDNMQLDTDESNPSVHPQQCDRIEVEVLAVEDDSDDDIDWEQLTREAHADVKSGNFDFISTHEEGARGRLYVLNHPSFNQRQLVFPMDTTAPDYSEAIMLAIEKLAAMEARTVQAVLRCVLTSAMIPPL